jgi:polysaccharide pyruvyl transferase WcaK-like protein
MRRGIYQGWVGCRNLGDEAIFAACVRSLPRIGWTAMPFDEIGRGRTLHDLRNGVRRRIASLIPGRLAMFGGGTVVNRTPEWLDQYRLLRRMTRRPVPLFAPGVADPDFWSSVGGWRDSRAEWRAETADLPVVGVRGPRSAELLEEAGFRTVVVVGDPALALHRGTRAEPATGRRTVGVNAGTARGLMWGSEPRLIAAIADGVRRLTDDGYRVRLFPMWHADEPACHAVARASGLPAGSVDPLILDADAFLGYLDNFDVVASMKLHGAVLAAAAGIPFVAIEYQPKVRDFARSLGWERFTFRSDQMEGHDLAGAVRQIHETLPAVRAEVDVRVGRLADAFRAHARQLEEYLLAP